MSAYTWGCVRVWTAESTKKYGSRRQTIFHFDPLVCWWGAADTLSRCTTFRWHGVLGLITERLGFWLMLFLLSIFYRLYHRLCGPLLRRHVHYNHPILYRPTWTCALNLWCTVLIGKFGMQPLLGHTCVELWWYRTGGLSNYLLIRTFWFDWVIHVHRMVIRGWQKHHFRFRLIQFGPANIGIIGERNNCPRWVKYGIWCLPSFGWSPAENNTWVALQFRSLDLI